MGAVYISFTTADDPTKAFADRKAQDLHDHGHAGYTGTFADVPSVEVQVEPRFHCVHDAEEHCQECAEKWGPAIAIRYLDSEEKERWLIAAMAPE